LYIFFFNKYAWFDRVFDLKMSESVFWKYKKSLKRWNLFRYQDDFFICLWNKISFLEQYKYQYEIKEDSLSLVSKLFLTDQTLDMVDWMVYNRYSNYKSVLKYFLSFDIEKLLEIWKAKTETKKKKIENNEILIQDWKLLISANVFIWQQLVVFPDLWSLFNVLDDDVLSLPGNVFLSSQDTQNQKDKKWRMIKNWLIKNVFCTHSEIFQSRLDLKKIILIDGYKRYYENQQDPRYNVGCVVEKMQEIYWAELIYNNI
jgi:hypothetical protein